MQYRGITLLCKTPERRGGDVPLEVWGFHDGAVEDSRHSQRLEQASRPGLKKGSELFTVFSWARRRVFWDGRNEKNGRFQWAGPTGLVYRGRGVVLIVSAQTWRKSTLRP